MTPNERKTLVKFAEIKEGNTVTIAGTLRSTINYAGEVCKKLCENGYLERLVPGMFARYKISPSGIEQVQSESGSGKVTESTIGAEEDSKKVPDLSSDLSAKAEHDKYSAKAEAKRESNLAKEEWSPAKSRAKQGEQSEWTTGQNEEHPHGDKVGVKAEEAEEYECTNCGTSIKEEDAECPNCGIIFEGIAEE